MTRDSRRRVAFFPFLGILAAIALAVLTPLSALAAAPQQITMHADEFSFTPNTVTLTVGQPVQLTIVNDGKLDHDLKSDIPISNLSYQKASNPADEQKDNAAKGILDVDYDKGVTAQVTFTPTKAGTYEFHCDIPGHTEAGMKGTFVVKASTLQAVAVAPASTAPQSLPKTGQPFGLQSLIWLAGAAGLLSVGGLGIRYSIRSHRREH